MRSSWENSPSSPVGMLGGLGTVLEVSVSQTSHLGAVWGGGGGSPVGAAGCRRFLWLVLSHKTLPTWAARGQLECVRMVAGGLLGKTSSFWGAFDLGEGGGCDACLLWLKQRSHCTPVPCIHADP